MQPKVGRYKIGKKNKEKMISGFAEKLNVDEAKATQIYETAMSIIATNVKDKLKHPFKNMN